MTDLPRDPDDRVMWIEPTPDERERDRLLAEHGARMATHPAYAAAVARVVGWRQVEEATERRAAVVAEDPPGPDHAFRLSAADAEVDQMTNWWLDEGGGRDEIERWLDG